MRHALLILLLAGLAWLPSAADAAARTIVVELQGVGRVTGPGIDCTATCSFEADSGRPLTAFERPGSGYVFESWLGCRAGTGLTSPSCFVDTYAPVVTAIVRFRDVQVPSVDLAEPVPGGPRRGVVRFAATASDNAGVSRVEFRIRGRTAASDTVAAYELAFDTASVPDGDASVEAVAFDAAGNTTRRERTIAIDNTAPAVATVGPTGRIAPGAPLAWTLSVGDASGVARVECAIAARAVTPEFGPCSGGSAAHRASVDLPGTYVLHARATDAAGNVATARPLAFTIAPRDPGASTPPPFQPIVGNGYRTRGALTRFVAVRVSNLPARRVRAVGPAGDVKVVSFTMRRGRLPRKSVHCAPAGGQLGRCA
jgi:hypothetical protein